MHKFKIGQRLFSARLGVPDGAYVVIKRLPMRDGEFEYQIKSVTELDERVVRESELNTWSADRTLALTQIIALSKSERSRWIDLAVSFLVFTSFRHLGRRQLSLILRGALPATPSNKRDEAQRPPSVPSNPFCGLGINGKFHWNSKL